MLCEAKPIAPAPIWPADADEIARILKKIPRAKVAVFGDLCLDAYWSLDADRSESSLETGLPVNRVAGQRYGLAAAGNVASNLAALGAQVALVGVIGSDCFGDLLVRLAADAGIDTSGIVRADRWQTHVFAKPIGHDGERERYDFGHGNRVERDLLLPLQTELHRTAAWSDVIVLNQQFQDILAAPPVIDLVNRLIELHPRVKFLADARCRADAYRSAMLKMNVREGARLLGAEHLDAERVAEELHRRCGQTVFVTRGDRGLIALERGLLASIPGIATAGPIDPVGAGDTAVAAIAATLAVGESAAAAASLANLAAAVTVRKLRTTGTATPDEILAACAGAAYIFAPDLAEEPRRAVYLADSEIEIVRSVRQDTPISHAIFDHDGTISTLRQGWEAIMQPMMVRAVLGERFDDAPRRLFEEVTAAVHELIDQTTGIQTLAQMKALIELIRRFGCVKEPEILDEHGYKRIYNEELLAQVRKRVDRLSAGELESADFQIKGSLAFLRKLKTRGVRLYLASGTDEADVKAEAQRLGYADLFDGGIFGAVGKLAVEAKREVIARILRENRVDVGALAVFGDGPVEMREGRRVGAKCIGIASDEPRRHGLDLAKRARLIRAGADVVVPDFCQPDRLLSLLEKA